MWRVDSGGGCVCREVTNGKSLYLVSLIFAVNFKVL